MKFIITSLSVCLVGVGLAVAAPFEERPLARRNYTELYADQLTDGTACGDVTVIYARGTGQDGNIGEPTDVGPEFLDDLGVYVGIDKLAVAGVNYSASVDGFEVGGDPEGSQTMADLAALVCPNDIDLLRALLTLRSPRRSLNALTHCLSFPDTARVHSLFTTLRI